MDNHLKVQGIFSSMSQKFYQGIDNDSAPYQMSDRYKTNMNPNL